MKVAARHFATALLLTTLVALPAATHADETADEAIDHIRLLERMLLEAGIDPPQRPDALSGQSPSQPLPPIVPEELAAGTMANAIQAINSRGDSAAAGLQRVRLWASKRNNENAEASQQVLAHVQRWADEQLAAAKSESRADPVQGYMTADDALSILERDTIGQDLKAFVSGLKSDRKQWRHIESMAAYRRAIADAKAVGLLGDWADIDFQNINTKNEIERVTNKLSIIEKRWPTSEAGKDARKHLLDWKQREAQALADLPAWRYTYNLGFIQIGTDEKTTIFVGTNGDVVIVEEEEEAVYDKRRVVMFGTFQNTSDKPYRYTFNVGASRHFSNGKPWSGQAKGLAGFTQVQTPVLKPGQVYNWEAYFNVPDIKDIKRTGVSGVEFHEPK